MLVRILQIGIVGFWLVSTGWLIQTVWFPGGLGGDGIEAREALDRFFDWNDTNDLAIFENGGRIGLMTISGGSGVDPETGQFVRDFSTAGSIRSAGATRLEGMMGSSWRVTAEFDETYDLVRGQLIFRMPSEGLRLTLSIDGDPEMLTVFVERNDLPIFQTSRPLGGGGETIPEIPEGVLPMGFSPGDLEQWKPKFEATRTSIKIAERDLPVFLLQMKIAGDTSVRLFLSDAGGPLRIETDWGYEAVVEAMVPVE